MHDLAVQIRQLDDIAVDEAERMDAKGGEVERCRGAEAAEADDQDARGGDGRLAADGDGREERLAVVAGRGEGVGRKEEGGLDWFGLW